MAAPALPVVDDSAAESVPPAAPQAPELTKSLDPVDPVDLGAEWKTVDLPAPDPSAGVLAVHARLQPVGPGQVETHVYGYCSSVHGMGTLILTRRQSQTSPGQHLQQVEWISRITGLTDLHGSWRIDDQDRLVIQFNCREGTSNSNRGLRLHTTVFWKNMPLGEIPDEYSAWGGFDDKECEIGLRHMRSIMEIKEKGKPPRSLWIAEL